MYSTHYVFLACSILLSCAVENVDENLGDKVLSWIRSHKSDIADEGLRQAYTKFCVSFSRSLDELPSLLLPSASNSTDGTSISSSASDIPCGDVHMDIHSLDLGPSSSNFVNPRDVFAQCGTHTTTLESRALIEQSGAIKPSRPDLLSPYDGPHMKDDSSLERVFLRISTRPPRRMVFLNVRNVAPGEDLSTASVPLSKVIGGNSRLFLSSVAQSPFSGRSVHAHLVVTHTDKDLQFAEASNMRELDWTDNSLYTAVHDLSQTNASRTFRVAAKFQTPDKDVLPLVVSLAVFRSVPIEGATWTSCRRFQSVRCDFLLGSLCSKVSFNY